MHDRDLHQRFLFEYLAVRGELVHLNQSWLEILKRHEYPANLQKIMGEMAAAAVLLSATLKFKGSLIMQIQGKGPLSMAVIEVTSERTLRGLAQWQGDITGMTLPELAGAGTLAITIDPGAGERYQGIVDLSSGDIGKALEDYMLRSQQLQTRLWLFANGSYAAGMLLQKMPDTPANELLSHDDDAWPRVTQLANTVKTDELALLKFEELIRRLYHEEDVRVFEKQPVSFRCSCTRERVVDMLRMLGYEEIQSILDTETNVGVRCQFCNHYYEFDRVDVEEVFAANVAAGKPTTRH
ncbi:MAG: Hsp33 family molecular chaperone HslO [Gammaproteobacteria bacterium]|nr:Hsp33 family molecular chaperone HslO [Gammaproteobacteria bacterium]